MLEIMVETDDGTWNKIHWGASAVEFEQLWDHCETMAANDGRDPKDMATAIVGRVISDNPPTDEVSGRGLVVWTVYAVLRYAADTVDLSEIAAGIDDMTIFKLAETQTITAEIRPISDNEFSIKLAGRPGLDS